MHLHRVTRDSKAGRSSQAVSIPIGDAARAVPRRDEAVFVRPMPVLFASAEARDVVQYLRMARGEFICRKHDLHRPGQG